MQISRPLRRRLNKAGFSKADINEIIQSTIDYTLAGYEAVLALELSDKLGFKEKRAKRFLGYVRETFDSVHQGYVSLEDIKDTVKKELNIDLQNSFVEGEN